MAWKYFASIARMAKNEGTSGFISRNLSIYPSSNVILSKVGFMSRGVTFDRC